MGDFLSDSSSSSASYDQRQATAGDRSPATRDSSQAVTDQGIAIGAGALQNLGNINASGDAKVSVGLQGDSVTSLVNEVASLGQSNTAQLGGLLASTLEKTTGAQEENTRKLLVWVALAGIGGLIIVVFLRK